MQQINVEEILEVLKNVSGILDGVIIKLRSDQHSRLQSATTEKDLDEVRTIKEAIQDLESVA